MPKFKIGKYRFRARGYRSEHRTLALGTVFLKKGISIYIGLWKVHAVLEFWKVRR